MESQYPFQKFYGENVRSERKRTDSQFYFSLGDHLSAFIGILDTIAMLSDITNRVSLAWGGKFMLILILIGLILSFIEVFEKLNKSSQKSEIKILLTRNITKR